MVSSSLFLLSLVIIGTLTVRAMTSRAQTEDKNQVFRAATVVLDQLQKDLLHCQEVYSPGPDAQGLYLPGESAPALVLRSAGSSSEIIGYRRVSHQHRLERWLYQPQFDPGLVASQIPLHPTPNRSLASIEGFSIAFLAPAESHGARIVETTLLVATGTGPSLRLTSKARLRKI